jgi:hypothetical protein
MIADRESFEIVTKLTSQSVAELVELADQCEVLCPTDHKKSGENSLTDSEAK